MIPLKPFTCFINSYTFTFNSKNKISYFLNLCKFEGKYKIMEEQAIISQIDQLKEQLTGNIFEDGETQQKIYELKKQLRPEIETQPELDDFDDEGCLYCGS